MKVGTSRQIKLISDLIKPVKDHPKPGILFYDITPLLNNNYAYRLAIDYMRLDAEEFDAHNKIAAVESRGFLFGSALSFHYRKDLILIRKKGKLPRKTVSETYNLEYGTDTLEMHEDATSSFDDVILIDDVIATGHSAAAAIKLIESTGAKVVGCLFLLEIKNLNGRNNIKCPVKSLITV